MTFWHIGRRGAMASAPENTMRSFRRAVDDGMEIAPCAGHRCRRVLFGWRGTDPAIIMRAHQLRLRYNVRLGETVADVRRAQAWGADGITTNDPSLRRRVEAGDRTSAPPGG